MEAVVVTDAEGHIVCVNDSFQKHTGFSRCAVVGQNPRILKSGRHDAQFYQELWATLKAGHVWRERVINRCRDGSLINVEQVISPSCSASGEITHFVSVWRNVTRERELLEMARRSQRLEHLGQLAAEIAHDFSNALTGVRGFSELLLDMAEPEGPEATMLREVLACGHRASRLARQLLELGKPQGSGELSTDLNTVITQMLPFLRHTLGQGVEVRFRPYWEAPAVEIDSLHVEQLLLNLCLNAKDAMPLGGTITLASKVVPVPAAAGDRQSQMVQLSVADTGTGMSEDIVDRLFDPFFTTKGDRDGTGLGLAIVRGIVDEAGGEVEVSTALGQGSEFRILLPPAGTNAHEQKLAATRDLPHGSETVLVVELDPTVRQITGQMLGHLGYTPLLAEDVTQAAKLPRSAGICDVALVEAYLPAMTGEQFVASLRAHFPAVRGLLVAPQRYPSRGGQELGLPVLRKPYGIAELAEAMRSLLRGETATGEGEDA